MAQQNPIQDNHPLWEFVRSMDNLGLQTEPQDFTQTGGAQGEQSRPNHFANSPFDGGFSPFGPPPPPPEGGPGHPETGGPPGGRGRHGRRGGHHDRGGMGWGGHHDRGGMGWGGFPGGMGPFGYATGPDGQWPFSGPPRGPGHRGRHHGRRHRSPTPSSSGSSSASRSRSRSRARSASPHHSHAERAGPAPEGRPDGPPGPPPHPHGHPHGRPGPPPHPHGHPHPHPHPHHPGGRRGRRGPWSRGPPPPPPFDINRLLSTLQNTPLAQSILQNLMPGAQVNNARNTTDANDSTSFTPPLDLFTSPTSYTIHVSLPGAKKEDIGIHYSPATSTLTISGVVYKPGSEEFLATLTSSERQDSGMFERNVVLKGNERDGEVDADGISAKLEDGILIVTVPRVEKEWEDIKRVEIE